jgi:hypothetical protein
MRACRLSRNFTPPASILTGEPKPGSYRAKPVLHLTSIAVLSLIISEPLFAVPVCKQPAHTVSISQIGSGQSQVETHIESQSNGVEQARGIVRIDIRNEGPSELNQLCATVHLADDRGQIREADVELTTLGKTDSSTHPQKGTSCRHLNPAWDAFSEKHFDIELRVDPSGIPLSGLIALSSTLDSLESWAPQTQASQPINRTLTVRVPQKPQLSTLADTACTASSKLLIHPVTLIPSRKSQWVRWPLGGAFAIACLYCIASLIFHWPILTEEIGGPQWNFGTSFATNFTVGTGLLSLLSGGSVITDALHYMTKMQYTLLGILFAGILLLAPVVFALLSSPKQITTSPGQSTTVSVGQVWLFIITSALMILAVVGQLITVGFVFLEIECHGYFERIPTIMFLCLIAAAGCGAIAYALRIPKMYINHQTIRDAVRAEEIKNLGDKFKSLRTRGTAIEPEADRFTPADLEAIGRLSAQLQPEFHPWKMF